MRILFDTIKLTSGGKCFIYLLSWKSITLIECHLGIEETTLEQTIIKSDGVAFWMSRQIKSRHTDVLNLWPPLNNYERI
ncbi:MAG TPA: hypothetical protein DDY16_09350 [Tenacibaculum sp.]|nr:hypothetical protein [Tenacibaculum sp.]